MLLRPILLLSTLALTACAIPNSRSNAVVVTDNKEIVASCKQIAEINGDSTINQTLLIDSARDSALARLKIRGAEAGGTHVVSPVATHTWKGPSTAGTVYKC